MECGENPQRSRHCDALSAKSDPASDGICFLRATGDIWALQ